MNKKHIRVIGTAGRAEVLVREDPHGRLSTWRMFSGAAQVHHLLKNINNPKAKVDRDPFEVSIELPALIARSTYTASRSSSGAVEHLRLLGWADPEPSRPARTTTQEPPDFLVLFDDGTSIADRTTWIERLGQLAENGWAVIHTHDAKWLAEMSRTLPDDNRSRIILLLDADRLRKDGASISKGSSWDSSYADLITYAKSDGAALFNVAGNVLVRFGAESVVHFRMQSDGSRQVFAHHLPNEEEGERSKRSGLQSTTEVFLARLTLELARTALPVIREGRKRITWRDDIRTVQDRLSFAVMEGMRTVLDTIRSGLVTEKGTLSLPPAAFTCAGARMDHIASMDISALNERTSLLELATHAYPGTLGAWAMNYVRTGDTGPLGATPVVAFGDLLTADRDEIEQYRDIRNKVEHYLAKPGDKPMAIGVFGPPGSGKTFGVKEVKNSLGDAVTWLPIDISGFAKEEELLKEWRGIRDENLRGRIPFVLIDEFDSPLHGAPYGWFQHFLRPVNDGLFREDAADHPIGRGIFVFTGGTCHRYAEFRVKCRGGDPVDRVAETRARERKMPDMARRLENYIDVKGVSAVPEEPETLFIVRRAIVMRKQLLGRDPEDPKKHVDIEMDLLAALLHLPEYSNGTSALCKFLAAIQPMPDGRITKARLPQTKDLVNYVDPEKFLALMTKNDHLQDVLEPLARMIHEDWRSKQDHSEKKEADVPWDTLAQGYKDSNRMQAMDMVRKLDTMGYRYEAASPGAPIISFTAEEIETMARMEHDRWMKEKLAAGWTYGPDRNDALKIHPLLVPYDELDEKAKNMDRDPVRMIPRWLGKVGFGVVKVEPI